MLRQYIDRMEKLSIEKDCKIENLRKQVTCGNDGSSSNRIESYMKLTDSMKIDDYFKPEKTPGFYPSTDELNSMTLTALHQLHINEVCYSIFNLHLANLCSITFGFSNHMRSPPSGSYTSEPSK
jgi:hypothetical protein